MTPDDLKAFRKGRGWTQPQLAEFLTDSLETRFSTSKVAHYEAGSTQIPEPVAVFLTAVELDASITKPAAPAGPQEPGDATADTAPPPQPDTPLGTPPLSSVTGAYARTCTELWEVIATGIGMVGAVVGSDAMVRDAAIIDADKQALGAAYGKLAETNEAFRKMLTGMVESGAWIEVGLVTAGTVGKIWRNHAAIPLAPASAGNGAGDLEPGHIHAA